MKFKDFGNLNILKFWKRFQILKGLLKLKNFQSYQKFSENDFIVLIYFVIEPILNNVLKSMNFIFRDWGKNPSQLDTMELTDIMELTDRDTLCTGRFRTRGTAIRNAPRS